MSATDAQVFDTLHKAFGVGSPKPDEPWFKFRAGQIAMMRRVRESRRVDADDLLLAVEYAKAKGKDIRHVVALLDLVADARAWRLQRERQAEDERLDRLLSGAAAKEAELDPDGEWFQRLIRASGFAREEVYREWREAGRG